MYAKKSLSIKNVLIIVFVNQTVLGTEEIRKEFSDVAYGFCPFLHPCEK